MAATSSDDIQLVDMLENYDSATTPGFQTLITAKQEFRELASTIGEKLPPGKGKFFNHQKFTHRFLRVYNEALIMSETGSGKSGEVIGLTEQIVKEMQKAKEDPNSADEKLAHFKRIYIITNKTVTAEIKYQIICKISDGHYDIESLRNSTTEKEQRKKVTIQLKEAGYIITTYRKFSNAIGELIKNNENGNWQEVLSREYSDTVFWVDEAHNLIPIAPMNMEEGGETKNEAEKEVIYQNIFQVFHLAKRCKRILTTATPMINEVEELVPLMNLILPLDGELPDDFVPETATRNDARVLFPDLDYPLSQYTRETLAENFRGQIPAKYFDTATLQDVEPYFRARILYIRAPDTGAIPTDIGTQIPESFMFNGTDYPYQTKVYPAQMSEFQKEAYLEASSEAGTGGFGRDLEQVSNFVFPDQRWGKGTSAAETQRIRQARTTARQTKRGLLPSPSPSRTYASSEVSAYSEYVETRGDDFSATPEFASYLRDPENIMKSSAKYYNIVSLIQQAKGNCFVFETLIVGSGVNVLALCLEYMGGFTRFRENKSIFSGLKDKVKPYCAGSSETVKTRSVRNDFQPRLRYALLTGSTPNTQRDTILETMNSYENRHGDYIKVLLVSGVGREGINVNNVVQIHLVSSAWHESGNYQAISRGIRATSHEDLITEKKEMITAENIRIKQEIRQLEETGEVSSILEQVTALKNSLVDPDSVKIEVDIYKHASIFDEYSDLGFDIKKYEAAERKDHEIRRILRMMKQCAVGCQVHYRRNVHEDDVDYSPRCDYDICKYKCVDPAPIRTDYTTYSILYAEEMIQDLIQKLKIIFNQNSSLNFLQIKNFINNIPGLYILIALERMVSQKIQVINSFGYKTYVRTRGDIFYLDSSYPIGTDADTTISYYSENLIAVKLNTLTNIINNAEASALNPTLDFLRSMDYESSDFETELNSLTNKAAADVLESVLLDYYQTGQATPFYRAIRRHFENKIYEIRVPEAEIMELYRLDIKTIRPGRPRTSGKPWIPKDFATREFGGEVSTSIVHTIFVIDESTQKYNVSSKLMNANGLLRVLHLNDLESGWLNFQPGDKEFPIYQKYVKLEFEERKKQFVQQIEYDYYAFETEGRFLLVNLKVNRLNEAAGKTGKHVTSRGFNCASKNKPDIMEIMWSLRIPLPEGATIYGDNQRAVMISGLDSSGKMGNLYVPRDADLNTWSTERLNFYYFWSSQKLRKEDLCDVIKDFMYEKGLVRNQ